MDGGFNAKKKMKYKKIYPHETLFLKKKKMILNICQMFVMIYMHLVIFYFTDFLF